LVQHPAKKRKKCTKCEDYYYAPVEGSASCLPCAPNTNSNSDHSDCDYNDCKYTPAAGTTFDLAPIEKKNGDMYGPIWDDKNHSFWLNPCKRTHNNRTCTDAEGNPILAHACQLLGAPYSYSVDLGHLQGYEAVINDDEAMASPLRSGVKMIFKEGNAEGCRGQGGELFPRSSIVHFICDPSAGVGYPMSAEESALCVYEFWWPSLYGCPVCNEDDYTAVYGACESGQAVTTYVPKSNPNRCHLFSEGAVTTPPPTTTPCTEISIPCEAGEYYPLNADDNGQCKEVTPGTYSIGGGFELDWFGSYDDMPDEVVEPKTFIMEGELLKSGQGTTKFVINPSLVKDGSVSFTYKVIAEGLDGGFQFYIDGEPYFDDLITTTAYKYVTRVILLKPGEHSLVWSFEGGTLMSQSTRGNYVAIENIQIAGTKYADRQRTPCKAGYYQDKSGQSRCKQCPANTKSESGAEACEVCDEEYFSLEGASECIKEESCEQTDFTVEYSLCSFSDDDEDKLVRTRTYAPLSPVICKYDDDDLPFEDNGESQTCPDCQPGFRLVQQGDDLLCKACNKREILVDGECVPSPDGTYVVPSATYYDPSGSYLPIGSSLLGNVFHTYCTGRCGTNGWREVNGTLESGYHSIDSEVESVLTMSDNLEVAGSLSFTYKLFAMYGPDEAVDSTDNGLPGVQFFIERNKVIEEQSKLVPYHPEEDSNIQVSFDLLPGTYTFRWVFHQPLGTNRHKRVLLKDVTLVGGNKGGATSTEQCATGSYYRASEGSSRNDCTLCEPGSFASKKGATECIPCEAGTYQPYEGMAYCATCPSDSFQVTEDRTACVPKECIFTSSSNVTFDLTALNTQRFIELPESQKILELHICDLLQDNTSNCYYDPITEDSPPFIAHTHACTYPIGKGGPVLGGAIDAGRWMKIEFSTTEKSSEERQGDDDSVVPEIQLTYSGDQCANSVWGENAKRGAQIIDSASVIVRMRCDPDREELVLSQEDDCALYFDYYSLSACRVCEEDDFEVVKYDHCDEGGEVEYFKVRKANCNGIALETLSPENCKHSVSFSLAWIIVIVAVFLGLFTALIGFCVRNRKIQERYQQMLDETEFGGNEINNDAAVGDESL